jgi:hypothetical protein
MTVVTLIVSSLLWSSSAIAQQRHIADPALMRQAIADQAATDQQNRDVVLSVLHRSEVGDLASHLGLSVTRAEDAVPTLTSAELERLAAPARMADAQLAGGDQRIVISLTTLLLVVILVLLLVR